MIFKSLPPNIFVLVGDYMSPLPKRQLTVKEQILGEKRSKESTTKKLENINSLIKKKTINADRDYAVKEVKQIITEWDSLWGRIHARGAVKDDKEKINSIQKRAADLKTKFEQKAKFAEMKKDGLAQKQYRDLVNFVEKTIARRVR